MRKIKQRGNLSLYQLVRDGSRSGRQLSKVAQHAMAELRSRDIYYVSGIQQEVPRKPHVRNRTAGYWKV